MKIQFVILALIFFILSGCKKENNETPIDNNHVSQLLLLKFHYTTSQFEEGILYDFDVKPADSIPIEIEYKKPVDFGNIKLTHKPDSTLIFEGEIIWRGIGKIQVPQKFAQPEEFPIANRDIEAPSLENIEYFFLKKPLIGTFATHPNIDLESKLEGTFDELWKEISGLKIIHEFMEEDALIGIFLYPASALTEDYAKWLLVFYK
jgi:hypothetical protein